MAIERRDSDERSAYLIAKAIEYACEEIKQHGFESLYAKGQRIIDATITIRLEPDEVVTVTYEKNVLTVPAIGYTPYEVVRTTTAKNVEKESGSAEQD